VVMPFGFKNVPPTYQRVMNTISKIILECSWNYSWVTSTCSMIRTPIYQSYDYALINVNNLEIAWTLNNTCSSCSQVLFWGYVVFRENMLSNPKKFFAIVHMLRPETLKDIQVFNGMAQYYRFFIKDFVFIMVPITKLLWKIEDFEWMAKCQHAWEEIKQCYMDAPNLISFHWDIEFHIHTNIFNLVVEAMPT
jgi:hypothetical protein